MQSPFESLPDLKSDIYKALTYYSVGKETNNDFLVLTCGPEKCVPDKHPEGPRSYGYFVLHYVASGKGIFRCQGKQYSLKKDNLFLIFPNTEFYYVQDRDDPWEYYWVSFLGLNAASYAQRCTFSPESPVLTTQSEEIPELFRKLADLDRFVYSKDVKALSFATDLLGALMEEQGKNAREPGSQPKDYISTCLRYLSNHFSREDLSLREVADVVGLNPNYLSRLFMTTINIPFSRYLILLRLQKAGHLLRDTDLLIKNIASSVGYPDPLYFSRIFKKYLGMSPQEFRDRTKAAGDPKDASES